ncbi:MAG: LuxR C-terminal-related transcriptional regulator [Anaerolineae bacterium]|nr:LuxR C-terminal-related transcriptional regulator [Anaerolineae bacterium]
MSALVQTVVNPRQLYMPFVGRTEELDEITRLLSDPSCHLLTLVGPGGIGKTRLGMETAQRLEAHYADGAFFVPLQALDAPEQIIPVIAEEVCLEFYQGANLKGQLLEYLQDKSLLLVLDNLEHLLDGVEIIGEMLAAAPGLKVLATARERLNLQEEWFYPVGGMRLPPEDALDSIENFSSVQLFVQHARRANPAFSLDTERPGVAQICQVVGGMPLGIELAAAWVRVLSCAEIAEEIQRGMDILETPSRNMPERHRNMRAVVEQSWRRLSDGERCVLMWLSVFQGGFTRDAASVVTGTTIRDLSDLVDKSWLRRYGHGHYDLHELLRQYAEEQLAASGEAEEARNKHSQYFADLMQRCEGDIKFQRQVDALDEIEQDFANVRAAWHWAAERQDHQIINKMVEAMSFFCDMKARFLEGEALFTNAAEYFGASDQAEHRLTYYRLRLRRAKLMLLGTLHDTGNASVLIRELETIKDALAAYDARAESAFSLYMLGMSLTMCFETNPVLPYFEQSFLLYAALDDPFYMAEILVWIGMSYKNGNFSPHFLRSALDIQRQIGDQNGVGWTLSHLAGDAFYEHRYAEADAYVQEAVVIQRERGDLKGLYWSTMLSGSWAFSRGEFERAQKLAEEGLTIARKLNMVAVQKTALAMMGCVLIVTEADYEEGQRLCQMAREMYISHHFAPGSPFSDATIGLIVYAIHDNDLKRAYEEYGKLVAYQTQSEDAEHLLYNLSSLGPTAALILSSEGHTETAVQLMALSSSLSEKPNQPTMTWLEKCPLVMRLRSEWEAQLGASLYAEVWEYGTHLNPEVVVDALVTDIHRLEALTPRRAAPVRAPDLLTERELEIMQLIAEGNTNQQIAERLVFAVGTVKWYVSQIFSKLHVANRTQAIARARELKLLA